MKKLLAMFKKLPPEMRMMLAMAGLGSPIGAIYALRRWVFPGVSTFVIILGVAGVVGVIALVGWLVSRLFTRGSRKRSRKMEQDLAGDADRGPESMTGRAAIKANNEKFFGAIREMRKSLGISVYDLPWYIVIGDSGCGKTKLINEGGLTFSAGKPEGYQLGTLNYNWWFTEDAVFVDMAGRLCNPQDDADHREWQSFLDTIAKGRKGYPINGVVVCVSAEHLLADAPEKHEEDANTVLERLRDLQKKLGVTFATYLVITKCDKILGFMQFFDRAERDITVKNQIFGWSKPGEFNALRDPDEFGPDFDTLYGRLNELRLRRLNDEADEDELGLAYAFPEEFRELRDPLLTYVRTLFPMIKNPKALKNLVFRGVYFTSATQQGALILKHLTERLGSEAAQQFQPLESLYPRPRPLFVKDLLFRKVFPEYGLVFRNEDQVARNRRLSKFFKVGTVAMSVVLFGSLAWSAWSFGKVIGKPRADSAISRVYVAPAEGDPATARTPAEALRLAKELSQDVGDLQKGLLAAKILSLWGDYLEPIEDLEAIRVGLFESGVLRRVLRDVSVALRDGKLSDPREGEASVTAAGEYMAALEQYIAWFGCDGAPPPDVADEQFRTLCKVVKDPGSPIVELGADLFEEASFYLAHVGAGTERPAARLLSVKLLNVGADEANWIYPIKTIEAAIQNVHRHLSGYAKLDSTHPNPIIQEWMRIREQCAKAESAYDAMLAAAGGTGQGGGIRTLEEFSTLKQGFGDNLKAFDDALAACTWKGDRGTGDYLRIPPLGDAILTERNRWVAYQKQLRDAYTKACGETGTGGDGAAVLKAVASLSGGGDAGLSGLDRELYNSLREAKLFQSVEQRPVSDFYEEARLEQNVAEVHTQYAAIVRLDAVTDAGASRDDKLTLTPDAGVVQKALQGIRAGLAGGGAGVGKTVDQWVAALDKLFEGGDPAQDQDPESAALLASIDKLEMKKEWKQDRLRELFATHRQLAQRARGTAVLQTINAALAPFNAADVAQSGWGLAERFEGWREKETSAYSIEIPAAPADRSPAKATEPVAKPPSGGRPPIQRPRGRPGLSTPGRRPAPTPPPIRPAPRQAAAPQTGFAPRCATPGFLRTAATQTIFLLWDLDNLQAGNYFATGQGNPLNQVCKEQVLAALGRYTSRYMKAWNAAYGAKRLVSLDALRGVPAGAAWARFAEPFVPPARGQLAAGPAAVATELRPLLQELFRSVAWPTYDIEKGELLNPDDPNYGAQMRDVQYAFRSAVDASVPRIAPLRALADPQGDEKPPWVELADEAIERWTKLCEGIGVNRILPEPSQLSPETEPRTPIAWRQIEEWRTQRGLAKETLTGKLLELEALARDRLDVELSRLLFGVQQAYFPNKEPFGGWPYVNPNGKGETALDTVEFDEFKKFLVAVGQWERVLGKLDQTLRPGTPQLQQARRTFVASCKVWRDDFLALNKQLQPTPLRVDVWHDDPLSPPFGKETMDDTPQFFYEVIRFSVGLAHKAPNAPGEPAETPIEIGTRDTGRSRGRTATWRWMTAVGQKRVWFQLARGIRGEGKPQNYPELGRLVLGRLSPLALCAYLHRYANPGTQDGSFVTSHKFDLREAFRLGGVANLIPSEKPNIGAKFIFSLERPMPGEIIPLGPSAAPGG